MNPWDLLIPPGLYLPWLSGSIPTDPRAYATCFTAGYGKSLMHSGSYLHEQNGLRRFSPDEILRLLGFPRGYRWPEGMPLRNRWYLAGNSLSLFAVPEVLRVIPALAKEQ